jgi:hypothetical protein
VRASRFALVLGGLKQEAIELDPHVYRVAIGSRRGCLLSDHLRHRTDKACAEFDPELRPKPAPAKVAVTATLVPPYAVMLR